MKEFVKNTQRADHDSFLSTFSGHDHDDISCVVTDVCIRVLVGVGVAVDTVDVHIIFVNVIVHIKNQGKYSSNKTQKMKGIWSA